MDDVIKNGFTGQYELDEPAQTLPMNDILRITSIIKDAENDYTIEFDVPDISKYEDDLYDATHFKVRAKGKFRGSNIDYEVVSERMYWDSLKRNLIGREPVENWGTVTGTFDDKVAWPSLLIVEYSDKIYVKKEYCNNNQYQDQSRIGRDIDYFTQVHLEKSQGSQ